MGESAGRVRWIYAYLGEDLRTVAGKKARLFDFNHRDGVGEFLGHVCAGAR
jgi:hypothetical protein